MKHLLALSTLFFILSSSQCTSDLKILSKAQMADVLTDMELAKAMIQYHDHDEKAAKQLFQDNALLICQAHNTDLATFQKSYHYYRAHPQMMQEIYKTVVSKLEKLSAQT